MSEAIAWLLIGTVVALGGIVSVWLLVASTAQLREAKRPAYWSIEAIHARNATRDGVTHEELLELASFNGARHRGITDFSEEEKRRMAEVQSRYDVATQAAVGTTKRRSE